MMTRPEEADATGGKDADAPERKVNPVNRPVLWISAFGVLALSGWAMAVPDTADKAINAVVSAISGTFGWYYFLTAAVFVVFIVWLAASRYGKVKLGPDHSQPSFSLFSWSAMLFAAGIGISVMFYSVAEPVSQYLGPPTGDGGTIEAARMSIVWTLFHYGITGWAVYAIMGCALAYFAYRYRLPLSIRSALYPIFGKRIHGPVGDAVDIAAILGTVFGVAVSLGIGIVQLNYGLHVLFGWPMSLTLQVALIAMAVVLATVSAVSGVDRGIKLLSQVNVVLAMGLMLYVAIAEGPVQLLNKLVLNVGDYITEFVPLTFDTFGYDPPADWLNAWTLFFWAWWIAWAPFVGLFLAKISRGRTIRQFVTGALVIPFLFVALFIGIFGNAALSLVDEDPAYGAATMAHPEQGFYGLLQQYPGGLFLIGLATLVGLLFFVTSADSGAVVLGNCSSKATDPTKDSARWLRIFWSVLLGVLTIAIMIAGGISALQGITIVMGLPFSIVMYLVIWGLWKALRVEAYRVEAGNLARSAQLAERAPGSGGAARSWRQRLGRALSYPTRRQTSDYLASTALNAVEAVAAEVRSRGFDEVEVVKSMDETTDMPYIELQVGMDDEEHFAYLLRPESAQMPAFAFNHAAGEDSYWRVEVYVNNTHLGYDVMGYTESQMIGDILDNYERHLEFLRLSREAPGHSPLPESGELDEQSTVVEEGVERAQADS
ncbi:choline BCCT transporter BetT [Salininema proteolyticum]|uniref:Choline BCCT transporter BetT n=1 Tax=Salininema proteolyticum TaxID=1607685 RepID=A0ABV8U241_9ACTN